MAKIILGKRPTSFKRVVNFTMLDGSIGAIEVTFKYRTRSEFGAFIDSMLSAAGKTPSAEGEFKMKDLMAKTVEANADYLVQVVDGWNLEFEFNHETAQQLCDEVPAAANAIMDAYRVAVTEGRLGN